MKIVAVGIMTLALGLTAGSASAAGDAALGADVFKTKCGTCHAAGEGAKNKIGPVLNDIVGRAAGSFEGYKYSTAMAEAGAGGLVWDAANLAKFVHKPKELVPGTKMSFPGLAEQADIDNVVAYLASVSAAK